jgi:hypothetical protein
MLHERSRCIARATVRLDGVMSKEYTLEELKKLTSESDPEKFMNTTGKDILEQSISDPDTPHLSDEEIEDFSTPQKRIKCDEAKK